MKTKTVTITGITGFVGGNLKKYLNNKFTVVGISRKENEANHTLSYDSLEERGLNGSIAFIHLAGKAHDLKKTSNDQEYFTVNTDLTIKLFNKFLESDDCEVFIFLSSVKAAAEKLDGRLTEEFVPNPKTPYGKSKLKAEQYILSQATPNNKKVYILRPCMIHGPNNKGNLNLLYNIVKKGIPMPLGKFKNKRSFLSIDNLCFVIKELIEKKPESGIYNLSDDEELSTNQVIRLIGNTIGKKAVILNIPKWIVSTIAFFGNYIPIPINTERLEKLTENYCVSNRKIKETINNSLPLSANQGFVKTINSFHK